MSAYSEAIAVLRVPSTGPSFPAKKIDLLQSYSPKDSSLPGLRHAEIVNRNIVLGKQSHGNHEARLGAVRDARSKLPRLCEVVAEN